MGVDLAVKIGKLKLKNPVMVSSGTFGCGQQYEELVDLKELGAIVTKTITLQKREGNKPPRIAETYAGMLNAIGLENEGLNYFCETTLKYLNSLKTPSIISVAGKDENDYCKLVKELDKLKVKAVELNISCPNVKSKKKYMFSQDAQATYKLVSRVRKLTKTTLIVKLSPNVTDIKEIAKAAEDAGAEAVSLVNTFLGIAIDVNSRKPKLGNITGGLSGPAIKPLALRMVYEAASVLKIPIIGQGGIMSPEDGLEFIIAGATAISIGTANFIEPQSAILIKNGIEKYLVKNKIKNIKLLRGTIKIS
ncbi:MAG: dihydroorotate dehydrogenase [Candidatus Kappaea frigidicola]|nr:dihydroorotate dehydrogenase [Candidatus Kappaea frigidicola]